LLWFTLGTGIADFFAVLLSYCRDGFVFEVYEFGDEFQRVLGAFFNAFAAAVAFV
jgi:hypothetical protein